MATYNVVSVRRTPQSATVPTYTELGPLYASDLSIKDYRTLTPSEASVTVELESLDDDTRQSLREPDAYPLEVWVYRDATRIFAGPVTGMKVDGGTKVTLTCRGRLIYLAYMLVWADKSWTSTDLFTIGAEIVDDWQALTYGDFGVDTSGIGTLGTTASLAIPGASEFPTVLDSLKKMSEGLFDVWADPDGGTLEFAAARGTDLSASVVIERGVVDASTAWAIGPGMLASEAYVAGTSPSGALTTSKSDSGLRASFGRTGVGVSHDPVTDSSHLSDLADADLALVGTVYFQPGGGIFEVEEATFEDMEPGNTVQYSYDAGLGVVTLSPRIEQRVLTLSADGTERIEVGFE